MGFGLSGAAASGMPRRSASGAHLAGLRVSAARTCASKDEARHLAQGKGPRPRTIPRDPGASMDLRRPPPYLALLSALLIASPGAARAPQAKPAPAPDAAAGSSVMRAAHGAALVDGELWGAGPDYKVHFRDGGFELTPAL